MREDKYEATVSENFTDMVLNTLSRAETLAEEVNALTVKLLGSELQPVKSESNPTVPMDRAVLSDIMDRCSKVRVDLNEALHAVARLSKAF